MLRKFVPDAQVLLTVIAVLFVVAAWVLAFPYTPLAKSDGAIATDAPENTSLVPSPVFIPTAPPRAMAEDSHPSKMEVSAPTPIEEPVEALPVAKEAQSVPEEAQSAPEASSATEKPADTPTAPQNSSTPSAPTQSPKAPSSAPVEPHTPSSAPTEPPAPSTTARSASPKSAAKHFGNRVKIKAGPSDATTVRTVSGNGVLPIRITRDSSSAAPNLPTYVSMICSNGGTYSAAYNTSAGETLMKNAPFSGNCTLKVKTAYPTPRWNGTYNAIYVSTGSPEYASGDRHYTAKASWKTRPVSNSSDFHMSTPAGLRGSVVVKLTGCSSRGGASDSTAKYACDGHVNKTNSKGYIQIINGGKVVNRMDYNISVNKHHDTFTIPVNLSSKDVTVRVVKTSGASVLTHGPGSSVTGVY